MDDTVPLDPDALNGIPPIYRYTHNRYSKDHKMTHRFAMLTAAVLAALGLSACSSTGYRCPLDPSQKAEYPTACAGMQEALTGARQGTGGKTSVLMDDKGRLVPRELLENKPAQPLAGNDAQPYRAKSGDPVFHQPKVFQVWTSAFVDAEGNLHDGHTSWFSTPGRWAYGTLDQPGEVGSNTLRPSLPDARPQGRIVKVDKNGREVQDPAAPPAAKTAGAAPAQASAQQQRDKTALQELSNAAKGAVTQAQPAPSQPAQPAQAAQATKAPPAQGGVTAPTVGLSD